MTCIGLRAPLANTVPGVGGSGGFWSRSSAGLSRGEADSWGGREGGGVGEGGGRKQ